MNPAILKKQNALAILDRCCMIFVLMLEPMPWAIRNAETWAVAIQSIGNIRFDIEIDIGIDITFCIDVGFDMNIVVWIFLEMTMLMLVLMTRCLQRCHVIDIDIDF